MREFVDDLQSVVLAICVALVGVVPKLVPFLLMFLCISAVLRDVARRTPAILRAPFGFLFTASAVFGGYAVLSSSWSVAPSFSAISSGMLMLLLVTTAYGASSLARAVGQMSRTRQIRFLRAVPIGGAVAIGFLLFETLTNAMATQTAIQMFPELASSRNKGVLRAGAGGIALTDFFLNRNIASVTLVLPAIAACAGVWWADVGVVLKRSLIAILVAAAATSVLASNSETAKLGLVVAMLCAVVPFRILSRAVTPLAVAVVVLTMAMPVVARVPYAMNLHQAKQLPFGMRERVSIWEASGQFVLNRPVFGVGANATRFHGAKALPQKKRRYLQGDQLGWHAHNVYLQAWVELGAIGAALLAAFLVGVLRAGPNGALPERHQTWRLAAIVTVLVCAATGWGLWQPWFLGVLGLLFVCFRIAAVVDRQGPLVR